MIEVASNIQTLIDTHTKSMMKIPHGEIDQKPGPGRWSKKEIIGHMVDSAQNNIRRFIMAQYLDTPHVTYNQDQWVSINRYQDYDPKEIVELWAALNRQIVKILSSMSPEAALRKCESEDKHTLRWLAEDYLKHLKHHVHQVLDLEPVAYP